ncbi:MAG: 4Fe-4S dicluster domain-containing protein [Terriglobales bacterium]|jgi:ferredoxin
MRARIIAREDVLKIVDLLQAREYKVLALLNHDRGEDTYFDVVTPANRSQIQLHAPNPCYPPKRFVLPHIEPLLKAHRCDGKVRIEPAYDEQKRAIFGIRSCDVAGIYHLDRFYLGREYRDTYYEKRRSNLFLVNFVCTDTQTDIGDKCFCICADTGPAARAHFDLQLMDLGDEYMVVAGTDAGEAFFEEAIFHRGLPQHVARRRQILERARKQFKTSTCWFSADVRYISQGSTLERTWEEIGDRCMECGGCTYVCPTCTCFTVSDRNVGPNEVERVRMWDSCALGGFTRMAGGFNPRRAVHDRRNRRFFRKLAHYFVQRELSVACVGCGRCATVCHGDIGMPSVVEMIRRASSEQHEPVAH